MEENKEILNAENLVQKDENNEKEQEQEKKKIRRLLNIKISTKKK